jgi:hypothetical protein
MNQGQRGPKKFKLQSPCLDEKAEVDLLMEWLTREPRFRRFGKALIFYNGMIPVWGSAARRPAAGKWHVPGVPDIDLGYRGRKGWVEMKREKEWRYQPGQEDFITAAVTRGEFAVKANGFEQARLAIVAWMNDVDQELELLEKAQRPAGETRPSAPDHEIPEA